MKSFLIFLFSLICCSAFCQNLTGNWSGEITQPGNKTERFALEINLNQVGSFLSGQIKTSHDESFVIQKFRGTVLSSKIVLTEYEVVSESTDKLGWCLKNLEGFFFTNKSSRVMEGNWSAHRSYQSGNYVEGSCPPGTFSISQSIPPKDQIRKPPVVSRSMVFVKVLDKETSKPVTSTIIVIGQKAGRQILQTFEDGVYKFRMPTNDTSIISIFADGYELLCERISTTKMNSREIFYLIPKRNVTSPANDPQEITSTLAFPKPKLGEKITLGLRFQQSKAVLLPESKPELDQILAYLTKYPTMEIQLAGHTDNTGDPLKNLKLSNERVGMVKKYLVDHDISPERITGRGFGSKEPIALNNNEENRRLNRRVELRVMKE
jgi:OOP family OmpA-OmpF porin